MKKLRRHNTLGILMISAGLLLTACTASAQGGPAEQYTAAEREVQGKSLASALGVTDPPEVDIVREVDTWEADQVNRDCLVAAGFPASTEGGWDIPKDKSDNFNLAQYTCMMQYPIPKKYAKEWGEDQVHIQYIWTRDFVIPCLAHEGYSITGLPSETAFVDSYFTNPFSPFAQVKINLSGAEYNAAWNTLEQRCTQIAPGPVLWEGMTVEEWTRQHPYDQTPESTPVQ